jgi:hypothetical protein
MVTCPAGGMHACMQAVAGRRLHHALPGLWMVTCPAGGMHAGRCLPGHHPRIEWRNRALDANWNSFSATGTWHRAVCALRSNTSYCLLQAGERARVALLVRAGGTYHSEW